MSPSTDECHEVAARSDSLAGDVLVQRRAYMLRSRRQVRYCRDGRDPAFAAVILRCCGPICRVDSRYCLDVHAWRQVTRTQHGEGADGRIKRYRRDRLSRIAIPLPPLAEQRRIADDPGPGGRAAGQAPRRPRPTRRAHPVHLPRHVRRPRDESEGLAASRLVETVHARSASDGTIRQRNS